MRTSTFPAWFRIMGMAVLVVLVLAGCGAPERGAEAPTNEQSAPTSEARPPALRPALNIDVASSGELSVYFPDYAVNLLSEFQNRFVAVQTDMDLARMYHAALGLDQRTLGEIELEPFVESELPVAGLTPACVAECTEPAWLMDMADWIAAARHIDSPDATAFFDALSTLFPYPSLYDGRIAAYPSHFERTWDYGGYSLLGSGRHTGLLRAFARVSPSSASATTSDPNTNTPTDATNPSPTPGNPAAPTNATNSGDLDPGPFTRYAQEFSRSILIDALVQSCIGPSAADARAELLSLAGTANEEDRTRLLERVEAFTNPAANGIQTGCATSTECTCMGG